MLKAAVLLLTLCAFSSRQLRAEETKVGLPPELVGKWVVASAEGNPPAFLEVERTSDLIGRPVTLSARHAALWTVYEGRPVGWNKTTGPLARTLSVPDSVRNAAHLADPDASLDVYQIRLSPCENDGKRLANCPEMVFALNPTTHILNLVTYPFGLAQLRRAGDEQR